MKRLILSLILLSTIVVADATKKYSCEIFKANYRTVTDRQKAGMPIAKGTLSINSQKANFDWGEDTGDFKYSSAKSTWGNYDEYYHDFLTYFQKTFKEEIEHKFNVNHETEEFSDYLLIPYLVDKQKCFGAYYINSGSKSTDNDYLWCYNIDYSKSYNFLQEVLKRDFLNEIEFNNDTIESIKISDRVSYFKSSILSSKSKKYILALCEK